MDNAAGLSSLWNKAISSSFSKDEKTKIIEYLSAETMNIEQRDDERWRRRGLALKAVGTAVEGLPQGRAFYAMIRQGSLEVFKLFLDVKQCSEEETFQNVANAMIELSTKRVPIDEKLEVYLQFLLSKYAHRNLCGDLNFEKNVNEWRLHCDVIADNWKELKKDYSDNSFANVDNMFLFRIHTIHNHLYFLKDKRFLEHLPLKEVTFCVAMFLSIFKWESEYMIYRMLINKNNTMQFLDFVTDRLIYTRKQIDEFAQQIRQMLNSVSSDSNPSMEEWEEKWKQFAPDVKPGENVIEKLNNLRQTNDTQAVVDEIISNEVLECSEKLNNHDQTTLEALNQCYLQIKYIYSIKKCIDHIEAISTYEADWKDHTLDQRMVPAVKRLIQVIGEAIQCTKNSRNIPEKVETLLERMLPPFLCKHNKDFREYYSHSYSSAKHISAKIEEDTFCSIILMNIDYMEMVFSYVISLAMSEAVNSLLGFMRDCRDVDQLKTMFQYVPNLNDAEVVQKKRFERAQELFRKISESFSKAKASNDIEQSIAIQFEKTLEKQKQYIEPMSKSLMSEWINDFDSIKNACHGGVSLTTINHMVEYNKRTTVKQNEYGRVTTYWPESSIMSSIQLTNMELNLRATLLRQQGASLEQTRNTLEEFGSIFLTHEVIKSTKLKNYYDNMFSVDKKHAAIENYFEPKQLGQVNLEQIRKNDEKELKQIFNNHLNKMQRLLEHHSIASVDDLVNNIKKVPTSVVMALEHYQLDLCEIFIAVGQYGDNFFFMKHRLPLIHGQNYRNYLAHDQLSDNILTDSTRLKVIINAFVMANCPVDLFETKNSSPDFKLNFPTVENRLEWTTRQQSLAKSTKKLNPEDIQKHLEEGADLYGQFYHTIGPLLHLYSSRCLQMVDPNSSKDALLRVLKLFQTKFPNECKRITSSLHCSWYAARQGNFEKSFEMYAAAKSVKISTLPEHFFYWKDLISYLQKHAVDFNETDTQGRSIVHKLAQAGNRCGMEKLLNLKPNLDFQIKDSSDLRPLDYAMKYGHLSLLKLLCSKPYLVCNGNREHAIANHLNELLPYIFGNLEQINIAIQAHNLTAVKYIIGKMNIEYKPDVYIHIISNLTGMAALFNYSPITEYLLNLPLGHLRTSNQYEEYVCLSLHYAIENRNWPIVELLLQKKAAPHWIASHAVPPRPSAFQLAVEANSVQALDWMVGTLYNRKIYYKRGHPLAIAIRNDCLDMVENLQKKFEFSMLDSNEMLQTAIRYKRTMFVEQMFQAVDNYIAEWQSEEESSIAMIGILLSRWRMIAYFEERGLHFNSKTVLIELIDVQDWNLVRKLIEKCKQLRKVNGMHMNGIKVCLRQKEVYTNDYKIANPDYLHFYEGISDLVKSAVRFDCGPLKTQLTDKRSVEVELFNVKPQIAESIRNKINDNAETVKDLQIYFEMLQNLLPDSDAHICGVVKDNSKIVRYFVLASRAECILELSHTEMEYPLKRMINVECNDGMSPLHVLLQRKGPLHVMELLISNGANPSAKNPRGVTPLYVSLANDSDCSKSVSLMKTNVSVLDSPSVDDTRPIHLALIKGTLPSVQFLIDQGVDLRVYDSLGNNAAAYAVMHSHQSVLELLLNRDPELVKFKTKDKQTLLHLSALKGNAEIVQLILNNGPDLMEETDFGWTAVEIAVLGSNATWLKTVLNYARTNNVSRLTGDMSKKLGLSLFQLSVLVSDRKTMQVIMEYEIDNALAANLPPSSVRKLQQQLIDQTSKGNSALHLAVENFLEEPIAFILYCQGLYNQHIISSEEQLDLVRKTFDSQNRSPLQLAQLDQPLPGWAVISREQLVRLLLSSY